MNSVPPARVVSFARSAEDLLRMRRVAAVVLFLLFLAVGWADNGRATPPSAAREACVRQWNWLHYVHLFVVSPNQSAPATVKANPCRIEIDYRLGRSDPLYKSYLGMYFPCRLNRFHAYVCAEHALGLPNARPRRGQNARYFARTGTIRLNRPPEARTSVRKPDWVRRYPVIDGYIEPFDRNGKLRAGLRLITPRRPVRCATFPHIDRSTLLGCGAGLYCFVPRLPVRNQELIACPTDRGSRIFDRGRLILYRSP